MRFLLINPFIDYTIANRLFTIESEIPPLGLLYIASALEDKGHKATILDFCAENFSENRLLGALDSIDAVGITVRSYDVRSVSFISDFIKKHNSQIQIIIGGPHCTLDARKALQDTHADICVEGEGERVIALIADALQGKESFGAIPGVYYKECDGIKQGPPSEEIKNLDSLSFPARHLVEQYTYGVVVDGYNPTRGNVTSIMVSRGCPYKCRYCINKAITKTFRTRSAENVVKEIIEINDRYDFLHIIDENFFADLETANKILDFLVEYDHGLELWISGIRVDVVNENLFRKMKNAGVTIINLGIESGNQDVLDFYNKGTTLEQIRNATELARKVGFLTIGYFMLGAPIETPTHLKNTINFSKKLPLDQASFSPFAYLKGSQLWDDAVANGKILEDECGVIPDVARGLGNFSEEELWEWVIKAFKTFYFRPSYIVDQVIQSFIRWDFHMLREGFKLLLRNDNVLKYKMR